MDPKETMKVLGITLRPKEDPDRTLWRINRHPRATIDHSKHPEARWENWPESPLFAEWMEAYNHTTTLDGTDWCYGVQMVRIPQSQIPEELVKKMKKRKY